MTGDRMDKRFAPTNSEIKINKASDGENEQETETQIAADYVLKEKKSMNEMLCGNTGKLSEIFLVDRKK